MDKALNFLNALIAQGVEYPVAEDRTTDRFNLTTDVQWQALRDAYDEQDL